MGQLRQQSLGEAPPADWLARGADRLVELFDAPTLCHLGGEDPRPLFVSCLLHGNEPAGWDALREVFRRYRGRRLPRALSFLIGNVHAAAQSRRRLPGQPDFNRVWPDAAGQPADHGAEAALMAEVVAEVLRRDPIASVDIHNNTGANPHYGCINELTPENLELAGRFSDIALHFSYPTGVQTMAFIGHCPAVTIECGQPGWQPGVARAADFLVDCLRYPPRAGEDLGGPRVYRTAATVRFPGHVSFSVDDAPVDGPRFQLDPSIEALNWVATPAGTVLGRFVGGASDGPQALDLAGNDTGERWLRRDGDCLVTARALTPAMLTRDPDVIRSDCLCYLLDRIGADDMSLPVLTEVSSAAPGPSQPQ